MYSMFVTEIAKVVDGAEVAGELFFKQGKAKSLHRYGRHRHPAFIIVFAEKGLDAGTTVVTKHLDRAVVIEVELY